MVAPLHEFVRRIEVGPAVRHGRLGFHPLYWDAPANLDYLILAEAAEGGKLEIQEISAGGSVPQMKVQNKADQLVLLPDGAVLAGSKQNRVINLSILLAEKTETVIPVSCVERGRWRMATAFSAPSEMSDKDLRMKMCKGTTQSLKSAGRVSVDQGEVWSHVDGVLGATQSRSDSASYLAAYETVDVQLAEVERQLAYPGRASGVAVEIDGVIEAVDLFDKPATLEKLWPKLVRSHVMGTLRPAKPGGKPMRVMEFLEKGLSGGVGNFETVGVGTNVRIETDAAAGAALVYENTLVHLALFASDGNGRPSPAGESAQADVALTSQAETVLPPQGDTDAQTKRRRWWRFGH